MESSYSHNKRIASNLLRQVIEACNLIMTWNEGVSCVDDYLTSPRGMEKMAACCMLLESIGESVKKLDRLLPNFLVEFAPEVPWREIKGLRDHIAHGYFDLDASIIFDVAINEIPDLKAIFIQLHNILDLLQDFSQQ